MILFIDTETYNEEKDISAGTYEYARTCEVLLVSYAIDRGPVRLWDVTEGAEDNYWAPFSPPKDLYDALRVADTIVAHNAMFDRNVLNHFFGVNTPVSRWRCTMVKALSHGFPGSLDQVGRILGLSDDQAKLSAGAKALINRFCKPAPANHKAHRYTRETHPELWEQFCEYARRDIEAMREIYCRLPAGNDEWPIYHIDQTINDRGFCVDRALVEAGARSAVEEKAVLARRFVELTRGTVDTPTQREKFRCFLNAEFGLKLTNTQSQTFRDRISAGGLPDAARELMEISISANKTSTAKYAALAPAISPDGRFRGGLQFSGAARTRRWAGRTFQPQNLPSRGLPSARATETYIAALKKGSHTFLFEDLMRYASAALRGVVIAPPGKKLVVADLSNIEGRANAWLAGERWKLEAFAAFDRGEGPDLYKVTAALILGKTPEDVTKIERNILGKVSDLACLAGDTLVLTDKGLKRLNDISTHDRLWDGEEWVRHQGVVAKGARPIANVDGIEVTPDHLILIGEIWTPAGELVSNESTLCRALASGSRNLPWSNSCAAPPGGYSAFGSNALAGPHRTAWIQTICLPGNQRGATNAQNDKRNPRASGISAMRTFFQTKSTVAGCLTGSQRALTVAGTPEMPGSQIMEGGASASMNRGSRIGSNSSGILSRWMVGTSKRWNWIGKTLTGITNPATSGSSVEKRTDGTNAASENCKRASSNWKTVYDIAHAGPRNRFTVKTDSGYLIVHNCGYEGGVGAFQTMAQAYGVKMAEHWETVRASLPTAARQAEQNYDLWGSERATEGGIDRTEWIASETVKLAWRERHPAIVALWHSCKNAVTNALQNPGKIYPAGPHLNVKVHTFAGHRYLLVRMPSGRYLTYFDPDFNDGKISYMGVNGLTRQWERQYTYGGKIVENACQSLSRDILAQSMQRIEQAGFEIVLTIHDEILTETPDTDDYTAERLAALMTETPEWAHGFPLAAAGFVAQRYRKD